MAIPTFANPSLSELMQPGNQRVANIQQDANQFGQTIGQLPNVADRYQAGKTAAEESARQNRPVSPWEKAAARLLAGHDPKQVAADTKAELGGGAGVSAPQQQPQGQMVQMPGSPGTPPSAIGIHGMGGMNPGTPATPPSQVQVNSLGNSPTQQQGPGSVTGPMDKAQKPEDIFAGMTHRDWGDYVTALEKGRAANANRDFMAEALAKIQGTRDVANIQNEGKKDVANIKAGADIRKMNMVDAAHELDRRVKEKYLDEKTANDIATLQLGYAKIEAMKEKLEKTTDTNERLRIAKMMLDHGDKLDANASRVEASLTGLTLNKNADIAAHLDERKAAGEEAIKAAKEAIGQAAAGHAKTIIDKQKGPAGAQPPGPAPQTPPIPATGGNKFEKARFKAGDQIKVNGVVKTVKGYNTAGKIITD